MGAVDAVKKAVQAAVDDGVQRRVLRQPIDPFRAQYPPLRDGDAPNNAGESRGEAYEGHWFVSAKNKNRPFVVDESVQPVLDESQVYSGCEVNMALEFYAYSASGNAGVTASLVGVQKVADGERLGGGQVQASDFFSSVGGFGDVQAPF